MRERGAHEHRMFRVIVLGGLALGATAASMPACGGVVQTHASGGSGGAADAATDYGFPSEATGGSGAFPSELPAYVDASGGSGGMTDGFPFEGGGGSAIDAPLDVGGSSPDVGCFPMETALPSECGAPQPDAGVQDASSAQDSAQETPAP